MEKQLEEEIHRDPHRAEGAAEKSAGGAVGLAIASVLVALLSAMFFALLARELSLLFQFDLAGLTFAQQLESPGIDLLMHALTWLGSAVGLGLQLALVTWLLMKQGQISWRRELAIVLAALVGGVLLNQLLKFNFERTRPTIFPGPYELTSFSFPSGHAMVSTCFYGALAVVAARRLSRMWLRLAVVVAAALLVSGISFSRVYFAVHYPTDVIAGMIAGLAWLFSAVLSVRTLHFYVRWRLAKSRRSDIQ